MSILTNRKGDWIQLFLVAFFFLLILVALVLLFMEKENLRVERPQLSQDLVDLKARAVLNSVLRNPVKNVDINGDDIPDPVTVADVLVLNKGREYDQEVQQTIESALTGTHSQLFIRYDGAVPEGWFGQLIDEISAQAQEQGPWQEIGTIDLVGSPYATSRDITNLAKITLTLPQDVTLKYVFVDATTLADGNPIIDRLGDRDEP